MAEANNFAGTRCVLAVGGNRHYRVHDIEPRHFVQTGDKAGISEKALVEILDELRTRMPAAVEQVAGEGIERRLWKVRAFRKGV